jgi:phosphoribosylformylglycinamidine synthase PurS subunit
MKTRIVVTLKPNILDPQGKAIEGALRSLGLDGFASVRQGKVFDIELQGVDGEAADRLVRAACEKLLANTIVENFAIQNG